MSTSRARTSALLPMDLDEDTLDNLTLPPEWRTAALEEICTFTSGGTPPKQRAEYWHGEIPWASPKDLKVLKLRDTEDHITPAGLEAGSSLAPRKTVLVVVRGMILLRDVPMTLTEVPVAFNQDLKAVIPGDGVRPEYLLFAMQAFKGSLFQKIGTSAHGTRTLLSQELARFRIPVPPLPEQEQIAALLSLVHRAVELEQRAVQTSRELKESMTEAAFTRGLSGAAQEDSEIGRVPAHWRLVPLGQHTLLSQYGLSIRGSEEGRIPILRMNCQLDGAVVFRDLQYVDVDKTTIENYRLHDGDLLFNRTNSYELVGRTAVFHANRDAVFASYLVRLRLDPEVWIPDFINYFINRGVVQDELRKLASRGVSQANISASKLKEFLVPVAPLDEQREIVRALRIAEEKIAAHEARLSALKELFGCMIRRLTTGDLRAFDLGIDTLNPAGADV